MSFLDDIIKKMTDDNMVLNTTKDIMKGTENLMKQKDKLTEATSNILKKEMPNIEREVGRNTLEQAVQAPNMMAQGRAMPSSTLDQQILNNSQGQFLNQPSIMPNVDLGQIDVRKNLSDTVASQKKDNFLSRLPAEAGKFMQSVGYGLLDKPLDREASTWDYLGKTVGQIARLNEGSGLGAGYTIPQGQTMATSAAEKTVLPQMSADIGKVEQKVDWKNKADVDAAFRALVKKYPEKYGILRAYFYPQSQTVSMGMDRAAINEAMNKE